MDEKQRVERSENEAWQRRNRQKPLSDEDVFVVGLQTEHVAIETNHERNDREKLLYDISDIPPWYLCIFLGLQHFLVAFSLTVPLILYPFLCITFDSTALGEIFSTQLFVGGIVTILQSTFGTRLPILQGGSFAFLTPTIAILTLPKFQCPDWPDLSDSTLYNDSMREELQNSQTETWQVRMREIQGAIILSSLFQVVIGACGVMGILLKYIGPLAIAPTIALIGLSLFKPAANNASGQWWIAIATVLCIIILSQFLGNVMIPCCRSRCRGGAEDAENSNSAACCVRTSGVPVFSLFPVIMSIAVMWLVCYVLTITDTLPDDPKKWGYQARTDTKIGILNKAAWFRFPFPFQWGIPTFSVAGVFGMLAGVIAGMIESVGDYYACARLSGAPPPPIHAINRGILVEGIGCILAGMWGTGNGTTSYSQNIGALGITRVGSRVVIQTAGFIFILTGLIAKFGAFFVTVPTPIVGGVFLATFGMVTSVGLSNLQYVNMNSSRNLFIVGFSLFFGLALPQWMQQNQDKINTGSEIADQIFAVLLSTGMFVGGAVGFILDNTIPGTDEERGIKAWRQDKAAPKDSSARSGASLKCYDLPWCMSCLSRASGLKYVPFCPQFSFTPRPCCKRRQTQEKKAANKSNDIDTTEFHTYM